MTPALASSSSRRLPVIDNETGNVVAVAGGVGEKSGSLLLNRALSQRQPGSAIKPLAVYAPALEYGLITPATVIDDSPYNNNGTNGAAWPVNSFGAYRGLTNVYTGLQNSVNTLAVKIMGDYITPQLSFDFLTQNLGFSTDHLVIRRESNGTVYSDIDIAPLALGGLTDGITTLEMAAAYASFPRGGVYIAPRTYTKVVADDGVTVLLDNEQESSIAMKDSTAWYINYMLRNAMINGTGTYARFDGMTMAGKTGTTSSRKDLYFAGYTPYYTAAVWSGYDQPERMSSSLQQQSAVIWNKVMSAIHQGLENASFPEPAARAGAEDRLSGQRASAHRCLPPRCAGGGGRTADDPHLCPGGRARRVLRRPRGPDRLPGFPSAECQRRAHRHVPFGRRILPGGEQAGGQHLGHCPGGGRGLGHRKRQ